MSKSKFNYYFYIRANKATVNTKGIENVPVYVRLILNNERKEFSAGISGPLDSWSKSLKLFDSKSPNAKKANAQLKELERRIDSCYWELKNTEEEFTVDDIFNKLHGISTKHYLLQTFNERLGQLRCLVGKSYAQSTIVTYEVAQKHLTSYLELKKIEDVELNKINSGFVKGFFEYLLQHMTNNSANKYMRKLRAVFTYAIDNQFMKESPFKGVGLKDEEIIKEPLNKAELKKIADKKITNRRLSATRDMFLLQCYTGLAFGDLQELTDKNLIEEDGRYYIIKDRKKTSVKSTIPLIPEAMIILKKYSALIKKGNLLNLSSNQKTNAYLKEIGDICGISKPLSSHIGRHTFATTVTLNQGIQLESLKHMMGLTSTKHLGRYAKMQKETLANEMMNRG